MPANLTPDYMNAEKAFKAAKTDPDRINCLQEMLSTIPKHKGTDKMQGDIKRRISKLKAKMEQHGKSKKGLSYHVRPEGAGQIVLVGPPNVGKSQIVRNLTNAHPEVAPYAFTTREPYPTMMPYEDVKVQLVDLPPVSVEHTEPWVYDIIRLSDRVLFVINLASKDPVNQLNVTMGLLEKKNIYIEGRDIPEDLPRGSRCKRAMIVITHIEEDPEGDLLSLFKELSGTNLEIFPLSESDAQDEQLEKLRVRLFEILEVIRIYSKPPGRKMDESDPFTLPVGCTLTEFAHHVHQDFAAELRFARCWGSARFDGQSIPHDHVLQDGDIVELHV